MNKENILKVADAIEKDIAFFNMQYPNQCVAGYANRLFPIINHYPPANAAIHLGLRNNQLDELFYVRSMGSEGITQTTEAKMLVPDALRWMVSNNDINWRRAFTAVMMDQATGKDK